MLRYTALPPMTHHGNRSARADMRSPKGTRKAPQVSHMQSGQSIHWRSPVAIWLEPDCRPRQLPSVPRHLGIPTEPCPGLLGGSRRAPTLQLPQGLRLRVGRLPLLAAQASTGATRLLRQGSSPSTRHWCWTFTRTARARKTRSPHGRPACHAGRYRSSILRTRP